MNWSDVGNFLKENKTGVAGLVGSLLTGNVVGAVSAGASMVAQATGTTDPDQALAALQRNPDAMVRLEEIAAEREAELNRHLEATLSIELEHKKADNNDAQLSHSETQKTIRNGDNAEGAVKYIRPMHATLSLVAGIYYGLFTNQPDLLVLSAFLALPTAYAGLREIGKRNVLAFKSKV
ncbi:hypothetical protein D1814_17005 [Alteromonas sp. BL110]|uniref:hypothetical protein n=1 Tax=unclassified Alteromonas TaxID=2614992 RepID=UPI000E4BE4E2|nr:MULTISPECIES: hypothetical protein [unclassified Alteromonas]AXT40251.1 hypothetical protein D1814_17005 [Alteromonas sp. BL110]NQY17758.1 hypothetical protein [Alteromonas sp.]RKM79483.1 hypothetical protein D7031_11000 [Alteromonas sp. BL110]